MKTKKIAAALRLAVSMTAAPMSASADSVCIETIDGTKVTSFDKYLVMESDAVVPEASFSFTIAQGEAVAGLTPGGICGLFL